MPFCHRIDQPLITPVLLQALFDLRVRGARALKIAFVHHYNLSNWLTLWQNAIAILAWTNCLS